MSKGGGATTRRIANEEHRRGGMADLHRRSLVVELDDKIGKPSYSPVD
jgi:hypothetical protein